MLLAEECLHFCRCPTQLFQVCHTRADVEVLQKVFVVIGLRAQPDLTVIYQVEEVSMFKGLDQHRHACTVMLSVVLIDVERSTGLQEQMQSP